MKRTTVIVAFIAILLLAACTPASTPTAAPAPATQAPATQAPAATEAPTATQAPAAAAVQINFWSWVPHIEDQVAEWNQAHPDIQVNYQNAGAGNAEYTKLNTALQANSDIPDVVQIEYQHLPLYIAQGSLLNLADYGANDVKSQFVPWTWTQVSQGNGVYAYPQDAGPMVMFCNNAVLEKYNIAVPTTWDEFAQAAAALHKADPKVYLSNFTADQGWFFGMLWQSGAQPFVVNGQNITVNFTSTEAMRVATFWGDLIKSGNLSPLDTYTDDWNTAIGNGTIACWQAGAWGTYISGYGPNFSGKWKVYLMPQWTTGGKVNGNYGGSAIAVTKASAHPKEAAEFVQWLNTDPTATLELTNPDKAGLFPVTQGTLSNTKWSDVTYDYWSGQAIHQVMAEAAQEVDPNFQWSPITSFVYSTYGDDLTQVRAGKMTFEDAMKDLQDKVAGYAKDQGFTVTTP
ncbi:MAG TPA: sugar ABC transporter substrate-binding protein [Anaerolineales bacterium]|nr:sugar ABC transporter substrate-binding protein [Anaerolineales bacterium]